MVPHKWKAVTFPLVLAVQIEASERGMKENE